MTLPVILLFGKNGQLGWELERSLMPVGHLLALGREGLDAEAAWAPDFSDNAGALCGDLSDLEGLAQTVRRVRPQVVVNAAAYTAVDRAESEPELANRINGHAPGVLAEAAHDCGALLVHYSTDYVFSGSGHIPWREDDIPAPLNVYGQSKLVGEQEIAAVGGQHLIFRTSWVYATRGGNFPRTMLRLAREREHLAVVDDQFGVPTSAELIADITAHAIRWMLQGRSAGGLYHLAPAGETTWYHFACHVIERARILQPNSTWKVNSIDPVRSAAYPSLARRPCNSRLDTTRLQAEFGLFLPPWQAGVNRMLAAIL